MKYVSKILISLGALFSSVSAFAASLPGVPSTASPTSSPEGSSLPSLLMLVIFIVVFYFLLIRPQMKRNKEQRQLLSAVQVGDEVMTASGLYGKLTSITDTFVELEIADKVIVKMQKQAIGSMLPKGTL